MEPRPFFSERGARAFIVAAALFAIVVTNVVWATTLYYTVKGLR